MIPQKTIEILSKIQSPNVEDVLKESMNGYNSYDSNKHSEGSVNMDQVEKLCHMIYIDWYNHFTKYHGQFPNKEVNDLSEKIFNDPRFMPDNISGLQSKHKYPFYTFFKKYESIFGTKIGIPVKLQVFAELSDNNNDMQDVAFMHVFGYSTINKSRDKMDARLYLNLKSKNAAQFAIVAYEKCQQRGLPFYYKFASADDRNDTFLFYVSNEYMPQYIEVIEEIKLEHPELLEGTEKISKNFGMINDYIGYGEEPSITQPNGDNYSYNSIRSEAINEMAATLGKKKNELFPEKHSNINNEIFTTYPKPLTYDGCIDFFVGNIISKRKEFKNCSQQELNSITRSIKARLMNTIKGNVLNNSPLSDIKIHINGKDVIIPINEQNIYSSFERCTGNVFAPYRITGMKAHLSRYLVFSSASSLTDNEQQLCQIVKKSLIESVENFVLQCNDNDLRAKWLVWLEDVKGAPKNEAGKSYVMLAAASFMETGKIRAINPMSPPLIFDSQETYAVYKELLGEDAVKDVINTTCSKYDISNDNICFNSSTERQIEQFRKM